MGGKGVVEAWVACFNCVERAVEVCCFDANLAHEILGEVCAEGRRVCRGRSGEERVVDEHADGVFAVHGWLRVCVVDEWLVVFSGGVDYGCSKGSKADAPSCTRLAVGRRCWASWQEAEIGVESENTGGLYGPA